MGQNPSAIQCLCWTCLHMFTVLATHVVVVVVVALLVAVDVRLVVPVMCSR